VAFDGHKLTIGFAAEHEFHKETLEHQDNRAVVEEVFGEKLRAKVIVHYILTESVDTAQTLEDEPVIQSALETFGGKVVSRWHNE
jgi:hypothetical protein